PGDEVLAGGNLGLGRPRLLAFHAHGDLEVALVALELPLVAALVRLRPGERDALLLADRLRPAFPLVDGALDHRFGAAAREVDPGARAGGSRGGRHAAGEAARQPEEHDPGRARLQQSCHTVLSRRRTPHWTKGTEGDPTRPEARTVYAARVSATTCIAACANSSGCLRFTSSGVPLSMTRPCSITSTVSNRRSRCSRWTEETMQAPANAPITRS